MLFDLAFTPCQSMPLKLCCPLQESVFHYTLQRNYFIPQTHQRNTSTGHLSGVSSQRYVTSLWSQFQQQDDISFLKINRFDITQNTVNILRKVIQAYVESDVRNTQEDVNMEQVLDAIDLEYNWSSVPFSLNGKLFEFKRRQQDQSMIIAFQVFSKIITFAAIHHLPKDMAILLFGGLDDSSKFSSYTKEHLQKLVTAFEEEQSWSRVEFPRGLSLQLKRSFVESKREKYYPLPRKSFLTARNDELEAKKVLEEAKAIQPPMKLAKKEDIEKIAKNLSLKSEFASEEGMILKDSMLTFFPKENKILVGLRRIMSTQKSRRIKDASVAGLVTYGLISGLWYTLSFVWTWMRLWKGSTMTLTGGEMQMPAIRSSSLETFVTVLGKVGSSSRITLLPRWSLTVLLSPMGYKLLHRVEKRFQVSTRRAVRIIATYLVGICIGLMAVLVMLDAILLSSGPSRNPIISSI